MTKYLLIAVLAGFLCGCASTEPSPAAKAQTELQMAKYRVMNTRAVWQADLKNAEKKKAYEAAVADLDAKTVAIPKGK